MPRIPTAEERAGISDDNINTKTGYPEGYVEHLNKSYVPKPNLDGEIKSTNQQQRDSVAYLLPRLALGAFTEIAAALPGISDDEATAYVQAVTPQGIFKDFVENKEGSQTAGALTTSLIPILGVSKLMSSEKVYNAVKKFGGDRATRLLLPSRITTADRVASLREKASIAASKQQMTFTSEIGTDIHKQIKRSAYTSALDTFKIGLGTDAGIYALLNESDFFFPDELTTLETAAFYGIPNVVVAGISGMFMRHQLKNVLRDVGPAGAAARNKEGLPLKDILSTPGNRDTFTVVVNAQRTAKVDEYKNAISTGDSDAASAINNQIQFLEAELKHQVDLMANDAPISGITKPYILDEAAWNTVRNAMDNDYAVLRETISLQDYALQTPKELIKSKERAVKALELKSKKLFVEYGTAEKGSAKQADALKEFEKSVYEKEALQASTFVKLNTDGSLQLAANSKSAYEDVITGRIVTTTNPNKITATLKRGNEGDIVKMVDEKTDAIYYSAKVKSAAGMNIITTTNKMKLILPELGEKVTSTAAKYNKLSFRGKTAVQVAMKKSIADVDITKLKTDYFKPSAGMHHTEADALLEIAHREGIDSTQVKNIFKFNDEVTDFNDLEFVSLQSKYKDFVQQVNIMGMQKTSVIKMDEFDKLNIEDIVRTLNLPNDGITGFHPVAQAFMDAYLLRAEKLGDHFPSVEIFKGSLIKNLKPAADVIKQPNLAEVRLRGTAFTNYDEVRKPVYMVLKSEYENPLRREDLLSDVMAQRLEMTKGLMDAEQQGAPLITQMTIEATRDIDRWNAARGVDALVEGSQRGTDRFTQAMFNVENQGAILAIDSIRDGQDNLWRTYAANKFKPHNDTFNKLLSHENTGDLTSFNIFVNQQGIGWRGTSEFIPVESGGKIVGYKVALEDHAINKSLYKKAYKDEMPDELFMPEPLLKAGQSYKPLVISPVAAEAAMAFNEISQDVLKHINHLRKLSGRPPIPAKALHMPPKNLQGKEKVYLLDMETGQLATVKSANTPVQAQRLADEEIAIAKKQGRQLFKASETELENYNVVKLQAFTDMTDFSSSFQQSGTATGKSFGQTIEIGPEIVTRMQESLINQYATISKVSSAMIFKPEFKMAEMMTKTAGLSKDTIAKNQTVWQTWMNRAMGNKSGNKNQTIGKFYGATEDVYDKILQRVWDAKISMFKGGMTPAEAKSGFNSLDKAVPDFNPFKDATEFLENTMKIKTPHSMIKHMSALNNVTGLAMLRMFEVGLGLINIGTLPTLIPPVARALARMPDESVKQWKERVGAWSSPIDENTTIWNPTKAFTSGMHFMFSDEWKRVMPLAAEKGHLWQKTVEQMQIFTAPAMGRTEKEVKKWIEYSAKFVDKTEVASRTISYATFFNMGKKSMGLGDEAAMDFAHHMANKVIGDFRPNVRPQVFQGATGMPFSLFTTFAWNYLQRTFGYLEKGQTKAFMSQMGLQAAFFGAKSLPGFNQYVETFTDNYDGSENLVDRLNSSFGTEATDWFLNGSVGGLTGLASYTRTDIVLPGSNWNRAESPLDLAAATSMVKQTYKGISDSLKSIYANEGLNGRQLSEIASRSFPIRALRGYFDIANGMSVDSRGQILDAEIRNGLDIFSKVSSIKTVRNQKVMEEFARQRGTQLRQKEIRQQTRMALRSAFRAGKLNGDAMNVFAKDYLRSGGEPAGFKQFIKGQMIDGLVDKAYLNALENATRESKRKDYLRMIDIISDDE